MTNQQKPWEGVDVPDSLRGESSFPTIQWVNQPWRLAPPQGNGGFFVPSKYGIELPEGMESRYRDDAGTFATQLTACLLAMRKAWVRKENQRSPEIRLSGYEDGARKRVEFLVLLKDGDDVIGPAKFTSKGTANRGLSVNYHALVSTAKAAGAEPWMFWAEFRAEETRQVEEHGSTMTPITLSAPEVDDLVEAYVGDEVVGRIAALADDVVDWATAWEDGNVGEEVFDGEDAEATEEALNAPVTTQKYGEITFGELIRRDVGYAVRVANHVVDNPGGFRESTVQAAQAVLDLGSEAEEEETEEIPF